MTQQLNRKRDRSLSIGQDPAKRYPAIFSPRYRFKRFVTLLAKTIKSAIQDELSRLQRLLSFLP
jgi:hypothetical protein